MWTPPPPLLKYGFQYQVHRASSNISSFCGVKWMIESHRLHVDGTLSLSQVYPQTKLVPYCSRVDYNNVDKVPNF